MIPDRIAAKIEPEPMSGCWLWTGSLCQGYGYVHWDGGHRRAHRLVYELLVGIPDGLHLDHLCRNRACVNPLHLEPKTNRENTLAPGSVAIAAINAAKTHCPQGHPYDDENTRLTRGRRECVICQRRRMREYMRRRRSAA